MSMCAHEMRVRVCGGFFWGGVFGGACVALAATEDYRILPPNITHVIWGIKEVQDGFKLFLFWSNKKTLTLLPS